MQPDYSIFYNFHGIYDVEDNELEYVIKVSPDGSISGIWEKIEGEVNAENAPNAPAAVPNIQEIPVEEFNGDDYDMEQIQGAEIGFDDDVFVNFYKLIPHDDGEIVYAKIQPNNQINLFRLL